MTILAINSVATKAHMINRAAHQIASLFAQAEPIARAMLNDAMTSAFDANDASGAWSQRDSFDMLEHGMVKALLLRQQSDDPRSEVAALYQLMNLLPTQTVRSEEQVRYQQFSTPLPLAWLATQAAMITDTDHVLEPSAGTGLMAVAVQRVGASLHLNELADQRRALLQLNFLTANITAHDGARIDALVTRRPSVIIMNPPFSRSGGNRYDHFAAVRHLVAALRLLAPGGRLVAIMPDWFKAEGRLARVWEDCFTGKTLHAVWRFEEGAFAKHGTNVAVRMIVVDKVPGRGATVVVNRAHTAAFLEALTQIPARSPLLLPNAEPPPRPFPAAAVGLFSGFKTPALRPNAPVALSQQIKVVPVEYQALDDPAALAEQTGIYLPYRPSRIVFADAGAHPTPLVESLAMGSIAMPRPSYVPLLPAHVVSGKLLSAAQLETIVYAGEATEQRLPGLFNPPADGLTLEPDANGRSYRQGFFLGDGTGTGKGRQIAGILLDQWVKGNKRHIWISESAQLLEDARRDWSALSGLALDIHPLTNWKPHQTLGLSEGVLFVSYPTLRASTGEHSRLQQILNWAGEDFAGVIIFDEAHAMGGVAGGEGGFVQRKGSLQGITGVTLQNRLPDARVIYSSATGASDVNNLSYAVRLPLWGPGTAFANRESFISEIREGGIAAMELVARELKGLGLYCARALSFAGVEYDILEHKLTPDQIRDFDTYADAWAIIHRNMETALELAGVTDPLEGATLNGQALAAARSRFESCKQRFFGQLLLSMKLPTLFPAIAETIACGMSAVVQLVSTAEAMLDRRIAGLSPQERAEPMIDLSPREYILDYLVNAFPTRMMESYFDDGGNERSRPLYNDDGSPVICLEAERLRDETIEMLCAMPPIANALDAIISRFGVENVAEITGRTRRLLTAEDGSQRIEARSGRTGLVEAERFMRGDKKILIFSDAGGTGRSYHASLDVRNQTRRVHFLLEPGWRADRAIQGLGRTNRTYQASAPIFRPVTTDCRGERRFISTIARRLDALGALTRGQRQTGGQNLFNPADNLESSYARDALVRWFHLLYDGKLASCTLCDFEHRTGLKLRTAAGLVEDMPPIQRWLNRILALPIALQNAIFDEFMGLVEARVEAARKAGTLDIGVETIRADHLVIAGDLLLRTDERTGATSHLLTVDAQWKKDIRSLDDVFAVAERHSGRSRFAQNVRSKNVALLIPAQSLLLDDARVVRQFALLRVSSTGFITAEALEESHWQTVSRARFARLWDVAATKAAHEFSTERLYIVSGQLLPIWNKLDKNALEVRRITTDDGVSILGRVVHVSRVNDLCAKLGVSERVTLDPKTILQSLSGGKAILLNVDQSLSIKQSLVNRQVRFELFGFDPRRLAWYKSLGCFTEIIQSRTRLFIPVDRAEAITMTLM
jgi:predicted RNA methylase